MWSEVAFDDTQGLDRCLTIQKVMTQRVQGFSVERNLRPWMRAAQGRVFHYLQGETEIALGLGFDPKKSMSRIQGFGFLSNQVQTVADLVMQELRALLPGDGAKLCFAAFPKTWEYAPMTQFLAIVPNQPGVGVEVELSSKDQVIWRITLS